jgi:hypothetical protein
VAVFFPTTGFFVSNNPTDIKVQMYLLEFIMRLGNQEYV